MSENGVRDAAARKRRVQKLKRLIVFTLFISILLPYLICGVLFFKIKDLNGKVDGVANQIAELQQAITQLQTARAEQSVTEHAAETAKLPTDVRGQSDPLETEVLSQQTSKEEAERQAAEEAKRRAEDEAWQKLPRYKVYLTFDDGPSIYTNQILDILAEYDVKATFFVVGKEDEEAQAAIKRIVEEGHTLGMHSYTHKYHDLYKSLDTFQADLEKEQKYLYELTGVESHVYRFPGGSSNKVSDVDMHLFADYLDSQGIVFYDWNISSGDGGTQLLDTEVLLKNCTKNFKKWDTAVILLHDSAAKSTTVKALPSIIEKILATEDTVILPITERTEPVQHIHTEEKITEEEE